MSGNASGERRELPSVSIIIEWENAKLSELHRAFAMLRSLSGQVADLRGQLQGDAELIVIFDQEAIDADLIEAAMAREIDPSSGLTIRLEPMQALDYYEQKNHGASVAQGELIVFLDSDVVPEPGWLKALLTASSDSDGGVVTGNTYLDTSTFVGRAFGLFWFFPLRSSSATVVPTTAFFANSVVFPRRLFTSHGFSNVGAVRGQCSVLCEKLMDKGVPILRAQGARASHPAPNGVLHTMRRAICAGHDAHVMDTALRANRTGHPPLFRAASRTAKHIVSSVLRVVRHRRDVGMPLIELPAAILVATGYYTLAGVGEVVSIINPKIIPDKLRV